MLLAFFLQIFYFFFVLFVFEIIFFIIDRPGTGTELPVVDFFNFFNSFYYSQKPATEFMQGLILLHGDIMHYLIFFTILVIFLVFRIIYLFSAYKQTLNTILLVVPVKNIFFLEFLWFILSALSFIWIIFPFLIFFYSVGTASLSNLSTGSFGQAVAFSTALDLNKNLREFVGSLKKEPSNFIDFTRLTPFSPYRKFNSLSNEVFFPVAYKKFNSPDKDFFAPWASKKLISRDKELFIPWDLKRATLVDKELFVNCVSKKKTCHFNLEANVVVRIPNCLNEERNYLKIFGPFDPRSAEKVSWDKPIPVAEKFPTFSNKVMYSIIVTPSPDLKASNVSGNLNVSVGSPFRQDSYQSFNKHFGYKLSSPKPIGFVDDFTTGSFFESSAMLPGDSFMLPSNTDLTQKSDMYVAAIIYRGKELKNQNMVDAGFRELTARCHKG